jgi:hypothetical protein
LEKTPEEEDFSKAVQGETDADKKSREAKLKKRMEDDGLAMELMVNRLGDDPFRLVAHEKTAKEMMMKLTQRYLRSGPSVRRCLRRQLSHLSIRKFKNVECD